MLKPGFKFVSQIIIGPKKQQRPKPTPTPEPVNESTNRK
jgi:hypothetical protein